MNNDNINKKLIKKIEAMQNKASTSKKENEPTDNSHLIAIKHKQKDFFIADMFDNVSFQTDLSSMEHPLFALKAGDKNTRTYVNGNVSIVVAPNAEYGMATIHDKDIWIYCISKLMQAISDGEEINRTVNFTIYDYLITTNRDTSGRDYIRTKEALDRLRNTGITTNIETGKKKESQGFGLISEWRIIEEKDGRMVRVSVTLPDWLFRSVTTKNVLTISPDYFRLRKPLDRRIYELARKHCGTKNKKWLLNLDTLYKKAGTTAKLIEFRRAMKSLSKSDELPDYHVYYLPEKDQILFVKRIEKKELDNMLGVFISNNKQNVVFWIKSLLLKRQLEKRKKGK